MASPWKYAWRYHWRVFKETLQTPTFWWMLLGVLSALALWFYLFYLSIKYLDTSLAMHSSFCSSHEERNVHILAIVLLTPLFMVGLLGVIGEWMEAMEHRRKQRKFSYKALLVFFFLMQISAALILIALQC